MVFGFGGPGRAAYFLRALSPNGPRVYEPARRARRLRFCLSASEVTDERVADRPSDERKRGALRKPAVICCAGFCIQPKSLMGQPRAFWGFMVFSLFVASGLDSWLPFQPPALPRTAGPDKHSYSTQHRNPRQMDHLAGIFYKVNCLTPELTGRRPATSISHFAPNRRSG